MKINQLIDCSSTSRYTYVRTCVFVPIPAVILEGVLIVYSMLSGMISFLPSGKVHGGNEHFALMMFGYSKEEMTKMVRMYIHAYLYISTYVYIGRYVCTSTVVCMCTCTYVRTYLHTV